MELAGTAVSAAVDWQADKDDRQEKDARKQTQLHTHLILRILDQELHNGGKFCVIIQL